VFARFAGCNLWSGREQDRATAACDFCDTDFVGTDGEGGGKFATPADVVAALDAELIKAVRDAGYFIAVETNGTLMAPDGIDWICVSPKGQSPVVQTRGQEL